MPSYIPGPGHQAPGQLSSMGQEICTSACSLVGWNSLLTPSASLVPG